MRSGTPRGGAGPGGALARWGADLGRFLLPAGCVVCGAWIPAPHDRLLTCGPCRTRLPRAGWPRCPRCHHPRGTGRPAAEDCRECRDWPPALARARWAWRMEPPADALVHALKYEGWRRLAEEMGADMAAALGSGDDARQDLVTPVPTTPERERTRGYNQARLLADAVAARLGIPRVETLARTRGGPTQVALPPSLRKANVEGAFRPAEPRPSGLPGARVVLVDDVLTTGATAAQAATVLRSLGAAEVTVLTYARALPDRRAGRP